MKKHIFETIVGVLLFAGGELSAQSQCSKGHFIFGTDLFQYSAGTNTEKGSSGSSGDTSKNTFNNVSFGLNVWIGYFVSNKVCIGLNYDFEQSPLDYYLGSYYYEYTPVASLVPSNLFFRYYMVKADSGGFFDLALEGSFGFQYTSSQNTLAPESTGFQSTTTSVTNYTNLNSGVNLLASFHISKHFAFQLMGGVQLSSQNINFVSESITPPSSGFSFTPSKTSFNVDMFTGSFRLQYYL